MLAGPAPVRLGPWDYGEATNDYRYTVPCAEYLLVEVRGEWTEAATQQALYAIKAEADRLGSQRLLLDLRGLSRPATEMVRFWSGRYLAQILPYPFKVAAFAKPELINKFGETVAVNRGAWFQVFPDEQRAVQWLTERLDN